MTQKKIRIYLADDHKVLIDGMQAVLSTNPNFDVVGHSLSGDDVTERAIALQTDVLVVDINMPGKDGLEVLKEMAALGNPINTIVLSSYDDLKLIKEVMRLGARGYLTKQCAGENIIEAILAVQDGEEYYCKTVREKIFSSFAGMSKPDFQSSPVSLTERELDVIRLITLEYSGREIGEELSISPNTVETHRKNLVKKLNVKNTVGLVKYAIKHNIVTP